MMRPRPKFVDPDEFEKYIGPTPEEIEQRQKKCAKDQAHSTRVLYNAYIAEGFTEDQALTLLVQTAYGCRLITKGVI